MDGLILLNKPAGITSFAAVAAIRRTMGVKRCGHTGTLDPMATGLLPILTGRATKLSDYLLVGDKAYRAEVQFGVATDSFDLCGRVTDVGGRIPTWAEVKAVLPEFVGPQKQTPPAFSAIKQHGVPLYKLARKGQSIDLPDRDIEIYGIDPIGYGEGRFSFDVRCSKGTYIRSLCVDLAQRLGTIGCMSALCRTETMGFSITQSIDLDQAKQCLQEGDTSFILPPKAALPYESYCPPAFFAALLAHGQAVDVRKLPACPDGPVWVEEENRLLGIGKRLEDGRFKIITHL